jgi:hypothetical protein
MVRACLLTVIFVLLSCVPPGGLYYDVVNNSNEKIFALYIAQAGDREICRSEINANDRLRDDYLTSHEEIWNTYIQFQGGWAIKLYPYDLYGYSKKSLDTIVPLKSWVIRDWDDMEAHHAKLVYP